MLLGWQVVVSFYSPLFTKRTPIFLGKQICLYQKKKKIYIYIIMHFPGSLGIQLSLDAVKVENPRDGGAWWAAVCGVTQSWTRLK